MSVFAISDLHLPGGGNIHKTMDVFGETWRGHVSRIEREWRAVVGENDAVVVGGDISWAMTLDDARDDIRFLDALPGEKYILEGNHDFWWPSASKLKAFFKAENITTVHPLSGGAVLVDGLAICGTRGWFSSEEAQKKSLPAAEYDRVCLREARRLSTGIEAALGLCGGDAGAVRVFLHFPAVFGDECCLPIVDVLRRYGVRRVYFGHVHGKGAFPLTFEACGIEHCATSADRLGFLPRLVS